MATATLGTAAATTLTSLQYQQGGAGMSVADIATLSQKILNDILIAGSGQGPAGSVWGGIGRAGQQAFARNGVLYIPNRGVLRIIPGDWVAVDALGWPILISGNSGGPGGTGDWRHS